jgi:hypothetical protein
MSRFCCMLKIQTSYRHAKTSPYKRGGVWRIDFNAFSDRWVCHPGWPSTHPPTAPLVIRSLPVVQWCSEAWLNGKLPSDGARVRTVAFWSKGVLWKRFAR